MELYLIRHGQSTNNAGLPHVADPPLSDLGKKQAYHVGKALQREEISRLYCSPYEGVIRITCRAGKVVCLHFSISVSKTLPTPNRSPFPCPLIKYLSQALRTSWTCIVCMQGEVPSESAEQPYSKPRLRHGLHGTST